MRQNFYPRSQSVRVLWHAQFATSLASYAVFLGIAPAAVAQAQADALTVKLILDASLSAKSYADAVLAFKDQMMGGLLNTPTPTVPTPPAALVLPVGALGNIEARTRRLVAEIRANPLYTRQIGVDLGLIAPDSELATPSVVVSGQPGSRVSVRVRKGGYRNIVLWRMRGGGPWEQIAILDTATFVDAAPPLVPGQPEERHYRAQGYAKNKPVGSYSNVVTVVTRP